MTSQVIKEMFLYLKETDDFWKLLCCSLRPHLTDAHTGPS